MSESSLNKDGHGPWSYHMSMQPDEIAAAEAPTLLDAGMYSDFIYSTYLADIAILKTWLGTVKSPTLPTPTRGRSKAWFKAQKPEVYN